jgi:acyl-coenzyme A thioesterase PaaI-like protein
MESLATKIPDGWELPAFKDTFSAHAGPFYFRKGEAPGVGFFAEPRHVNGGGVVHGGALLTLADMSLWDIARRAIGPFRGVTLTLNGEFLEPGEIGAFIEARGELTKRGKSLLFARGLIVQDGKTLMSFSGTLKRFA